MKNRKGLTRTYMRPRPFANMPVTSRITLQDVVSFDIQDTHSLDQSATRGQIFIAPPGVKSLFLTPKSSGDREAKKKKKGKKGTGVPREQEGFACNCRKDGRRPSGNDFQK